ncbi:MAG: FAD-dependent oxidoreductase, partial [Rubrivivax sp.]
MATDSAAPSSPASASKTAPTDYDLITIGAGSGGVAASRRASSHGARVAIIEGSRVGGTCVIRGCVPKKLLMYAAQLGDAIKDAAAYGWQVEQGGFHMPHWASTKSAEIDRLEGIYRKLLRGSGVTLFEGEGRLDGPQQVVVKTA